MSPPTSCRDVPRVLFAVGLACLCLAGQFSKGQTPESADAHLARGTRLLQAGDLKQAKVEFQTAVQLNPRLPRAFLFLGIAENQLENYPAAVRAFRQALSLDPVSDAAHYNLALSLLHLQENDEALRELEETIKLNPRLDAAQYNLGVILFEKGRYEDSILHLEAARGVHPADPAVVTRLAEAYLGAGQPARARDLLEPLQAGQPSGQILYVLGLAYGELGQAEQARQAFQKALTSRPDDARIHYSFGKLLLKSGQELDRKAGVEEIRQAIRLDPHRPEYYSTLARRLLDMAQWQAAVDLTQRALENVPPSSEFYLILALAEGELHGATSAMPFARKAIELDPQSAPAFNILGSLYLRLGDDRNALKNYQRSAELSPQNPLYFYNVAVVLERLNQVSESLRFAQQAVRLKGDDSFYHYQLGKLYAKLGRATDAIRELEACVQLDPKVEYPYYLLARTYLRLGDPAKAQEWTQKLQGLKEEKDRAVGLLAPASETYRRLDSSMAPWKTPGMGPPRPERTHP